jgi:hypothetical protein
LAQVFVSKRIAGLVASRTLISTRAGRVRHSSSAKIGPAWHRRDRRIRATARTLVRVACRRKSVPHRRKKRRSRLLTSPRSAIAKGAWPLQKSARSTTRPQRTQCSLRQRTSLSVKIGSKKLLPLLSVFAWINSLVVCLSVSRILEPSSAFFEVPVGPSVAYIWEGWGCIREVPLSFGEEYPCGDRCLFSLKEWNQYLLIRLAEGPPCGVVARQSTRGPLVGGPVVSYCRGCRLVYRGRDGGVSKSQNVKLFDDPVLEPYF